MELIEHSLVEACADSVGLRVNRPLRLLFSNQMEIARVHSQLGNGDADKRDRVSVCIGDNGSSGGIHRMII